MNKDHKIRLSTKFLLGLSREKAKLVFSILSIHSAAERIINAIYERENEKLPNRFAWKLKIIHDETINGFLKKLNDARNLCAHRKPHFNENEVIPILEICRQLIDIAKEVNIEKYRAFEESFPSSLFVAAAVIFELMMETYNVEINDPIVLDGLYLPGQKSLADRITEIVGYY